jgi:iron(III) transport system permease protein
MEAGLRGAAAGSHAGWTRRRISPLVALLAAILLVLILPPTLFLVGISLHTTRPDGSFGQFTLQYYGQLFSSPYFAASLWNTVLYAIGCAIVAITLGVLAALLVERTNAPGRGYAFLAAILSLGIPHVLYVVACCCLAPPGRSMR